MDVIIKLLITRQIKFLKRLDKGGIGIVLLQCWNKRIIGLATLLFYRNTWKTISTHIILLPTHFIILFYTSCKAGEKKRMFLLLS